jgi:hypothetical protein
VLACKDVNRPYECYEDWLSVHTGRGRVSH